MEPMKTAVSQSGNHYSLTGRTKRVTPRNHAKDREAREAWFKRKELRPVQITSPDPGHVIGWLWIRVGEETLVELQEEQDFD